jgi:hypothetical protein
MSQRSALVRVTADSKVVFPRAELNLISPKLDEVEYDYLHEFYHVNSGGDNLHMKLAPS